MNEIHVSRIENKIKELCVAANRTLPEDVERCIVEAKNAEAEPLAKSAMTDICDNMAAARRLGLPICQDTGMAVIFLDIGQEVHLVGGDLTEAANRGVASGYLEGFLRCSVVADPLRRENTRNNTPAILHTRIVPGESLKITVMPKGFGSENMSKIIMLNPTASREDVINTVVETVRSAGSNPCPPVVVGVGIGGDFEYAAILAKRALCRPLDTDHDDPAYAALERAMLAAVNGLGIGPQGFSGKTTALKVNVEIFATHIAGLPLAVNIGCHVSRHQSAVIF